MEASATGCSNIISLDTLADYDQPQAMLSVKCTSCSATLNDTISAVINGTTVFTGNVKNITRYRSSSGFYYEVSAYDKLIQASDYFIAADDPDNPYEADNIAVEDLVGDLLEMASLTGYLYTSPGMTLATIAPYPIDRIYVWEMISKIAVFCGYHIWCDTSGSVHFKELKEEPYGAASHNFTTGNDGELIEISRTISEENLRNRIVVYGSYGIVGISSGSSPYLPAGFTKTGVFGHPAIDTQTAADDAADWNLARWNKLTERVECQIVGDETVFFGQTVTATETETGTSGSWFVRTLAHSFSRSGFITNITLAR